MPSDPPRPNQVVILGAGRGVRGGMPSAMVDIDEHGRVMDWLLDAFAELAAPQVCFVGGYKAHEVVERYPQVRTVFNRDWARTGPVHSLGLAPLDPAADTFVCYADVVFRRAAVAAVRDAPGDAVIAVDTSWRDRYDGRTRVTIDAAEKVTMATGTDRSGEVAAIGSTVEVDTADAEFAGLLRLTGAATDAVVAALHAGSLPPTATLPHLVSHLLDRGFRVHAVDLHGAWAELDAKQDLARFVLGTKAESLERLSEMSHGGEIGALVSFTSAAWADRSDDLVDRVLTHLGGDELIVRSSALAEDSWTESHAGHFESILHVARTPGAVREAVDAVFASYGPDRPDNQVLVQEMLRDVAMSGVVMTRTHATSAPYYVINFDDSTSRTDTVTGGGDARTVFLHRGSALRAEGVPAQLAQVISTVQSIEKLVGHDSLDIEFAVTLDDRVHILQVRPIAVTHAPEPIDDDLINAALVEARRFLVARDAPSPTLAGRHTRYSVMSDWNPAEIIGTKPKRLAFSLYRLLITDDVWAQQRAEYGYRDVRPCPLLVDILGHPYVDVRATFTSFVPAALPDPLAHRLVDHYVDRLAANPHLHDKVEFDVLFTCVTPDFASQAERLTSAGFSPEEVEALRRALLDVTAGGFARVDDDRASVEALDERIAGLRRSELPPLDRAYHLLEAVRRSGTLTFSHLARSAFVATAVLRSLEVTGALSRHELDAYLASIETVLGRMQDDGRRVAAGELAWNDFVAAYGHLRPGTYDITSPCYRAAPEAYLRPVVDQAATSPPPPSHGDAWDEATRGRIAEALARVGLTNDVDAFDRFARVAISGRELGKFVFTKALSDALEALATFGEGLGLSRDELAHLSIADLLACRDALVAPTAFLTRRVQEGRDAYSTAQGVCLPGQIASADDLTCFEQESAEPNFVTQLVAEGAVVAAGLSPDVPVDGKIVLIPNADPGYDWLLARSIGGLVTMYGGANSHMAVRAAELGLPAAIGVGELLYAELEPATTIRIDCASRTITVVH